MTESVVPASIQVALQWAGDMVSPPSPVNQILIAADGPTLFGTTSGLHVLNFGFVSPPAIAGEMTAEIAESLSGQTLPIIPVARLSITTERLREFHDLLGTHLENNG